MGISLVNEHPLTVEEVIDTFKVHRNTVGKWFKAGLERVRLRGRVYTTLEALDRFAIQDSEAEAGGVGGEIGQGDAIRPAAAIAIAISGKPKASSRRQKVEVDDWAVEAERRRLEE